MAGDRVRARVFGEVADLYDRRRPDYPSALYDNLVALLGRAERALEAGAGTGRATVELARRGFEVVALEPDAAMAALARRATVGLRVEVEERPFEEWRGEAGTFDLVACAQAWHWIDHLRGPIVARRALRPGGLLAMWWNQAGEWDGPVHAALDAAYERHASELAASVVNRSVHPLPSEAVSIDGFEPIVSRTYRWEQRYDAIAYSELLQTHSDHRLLPAGQLGELLRAVTEAIETVGGGEIVYRYRTELLTARRTLGKTLGEGASD